MSPQESRHVLVGQSPRARQILKLIDKLGSCRWPALLLGETGTGKEVVAREIYARNPAGPFVTIDCSSMVGPLMESELFGHVRGAFTGAAGAKTGLIEAANGGTAFFDEIGELPLDLQAKLLRVPRDCGYESRFGQRSRERRLPPRLVLSLERGQHSSGALARAEGRYSIAD